MMFDPAFRTSKVPQLVTTTAELRAAIAARAGSNSAGSAAQVHSYSLVPTMGALHAGHSALVRAARSANDVVVVSIFVNPLQFGEVADLDRYPRSLDSDVALLVEAGADIIFAPSVEEMYPSGAPVVRLTAGSLGIKYEGASRPGHFDGMLTVVSKLLHLCAPGSASAYRVYFGQKDAQQLALVRRMVVDLDFPAEVHAVPTMRSNAGLALSSRNRFLEPEQADAALVLIRALRLLEARALAREPLDPESAVALIRSQPMVELDYFEVVDADSLEPLAFNCRETPFTGTALALVAARVGPVRLIDNLPLRTRD